jgi:hypothetical protein
MAQWTLTDNSSGSPVVLTFDINPVGFDPPGRTATIQTRSTSAPNGQPIMFQGHDEIPRASFKGAVITETFYNSLVTWSAKRYPLVLADDEGSTWTILITEWKWSRVKRRNPWRYDYTAVVLVL